ncbi:signal peptidase I [Orrella sp. NBD-18]|uniref:Signal peptidase I n=1 Tax=Sheuella amnicola TaxID=2707330 RepID=A0A6B2R1B0_9BURK|nr:signal peptidase I [Sheuella amnicola]NDY83139.1 signal peptidase I [Sheuella amnicola]
MSWNFALILFVLLVTTGIIWTMDRFWLSRARRARVNQALDLARPSWAGLPATEVQAREDQIRAEIGHIPWWVEYGVSFFPVILFVFVLRSFIVEPFRIPSGSMLPTLQSGDLILVNKFTYGIRLPVLDAKIIKVGSPQRGDVMVFRYPVDPSVDYIKRVVGLPGDEIAYLDKKLLINGKPVPRIKDGDYLEQDGVAYTAHFIPQFIEQLGEVEHKILVEERSYQDLRPISNFPYREKCEYLSNGIRCTVPEGVYFMMGDNRDNSLDSRFWGFVPEANIVGRAFFIWMNFGNLGRIGRFH